MDSLGSSVLLPTAVSARHRRLRSSAVLFKYRVLDSAALHLPEDQNILFKKLQNPELSK